jgi:hypothetical protein
LYFIVVMGSSSYFSSYCWASVTNVLQTYWLIVLPLDVPALATSLLYEILTARGGVIYTLFLDVPTFATNRLREILAAECGTTWADEFCLNMPDFHVTFRDLLHVVNLRHGSDGFTSPPKEGVLRTFSSWKIRRLRSGLNPPTWVPKAGTLPLDHRIRLVLVLVFMLSCFYWNM